MNTKIKSFLLAAFLVTAIGLKAQEAGGYEFAIVEGGLATKIVITNNKDIERISIPKGTNSFVCLIQKVEELNKEGWEVFNTVAMPISGYHYFYLRRKIK